MGVLGYMHGKHRKGNRVVGLDSLLDSGQVWLYFQYEDS